MAISLLTIKPLRKRILLLSADVKPTVIPGTSQSLPSGSTCLETDTGEPFIYDGSGLLAGWTIDRRQEVN